MYNYTIKLSEKKEILLLDEQGKAVKTTDILQKTESTVFAFDGPMGAGKTTFIRQLCADLGSEDIVNSPTFAIVNVYDYPTDEGKREIYHFDCYRIKDMREALDFGAEEYLYSGEYCFIEWPENIEQILPENTVWVKIVPQENGDRQLRLML